MISNTPCATKIGLIHTYTLDTGNIMSSKNKLRLVIVLQFTNGKIRIINKSTLASNHTIDSYTIFSLKNNSILLVLWKFKSLRIFVILVSQESKKFMKFHLNKHIKWVTRYFCHVFLLFRHELLILDVTQTRIPRNRVFYGGIRFYCPNIYWNDISSLFYRTTKKNLTLSPSNVVWTFSFRLSFARIHHCEY